MADFRQWALEFVLADDEGQQTAIAQKAANEIQTAPANTNPVARWVEAVQPWMPDSGNEAENETPDWTARSKALEFLSRTLDFLSKDVLKPSQVKLLVSFFGAMFEVDHKAGILPSATALSRIVAMKSFQRHMGHDIIQKICSLKDDFPRQVSKTRLEIYELIRLLMTTPGVSSDLQNTHGSSAGFMLDLIQLCRSERDPECLMVWFDILRLFMAEYTVSQDVLEEAYGVFKPYFPISLPRASQVSITPEELKLQLRQCFSANHLLADKVFTFLLGKLDQGDAVTVNVKIDILKTLQACLDTYSHPQKSIAPYANQIWGSLKYEVRNGEIEDTIWGTLEVLKSLTRRLTGDNLRDYTLSVTRDCVPDLATTMYAASAGRLVVSVLSSKPSAFVLMAAPILTHIKENLRHPKAPVHSQDLLKVLHVILETRLLLNDSDMSAEEREDFAAIDSFFKSLYVDVYKNTIQLGSKIDASYDDIKVASQAVQGAGALVCQRPAKSSDLSSNGASPASERLLPEEICSEICESLFVILKKSCPGHPRSPGGDELINDTAKALQRAVCLFPHGFNGLVDESVNIIRSSRQNSGAAEASETVTTLGGLIGFIGSSELPSSPTSGFDHFYYSARALSLELFDAIEAKSDSQIWCALIATIQSIARYFNDACMATDPDKNLPLEDEPLQKIGATYTDLNQLGNEKQAGSSLEYHSRVSQTASVAEIRNEFLLVTLFICKQLYRRATKVIETHPQTGKQALSLSDDFANVDQASGHQYLHLISTLAGFAIHEFNESQQTLLKAECFAINLFREDSITIPQETAKEQTVLENSSSWNWLVSEAPNVLSLGILQALQPSAVARLFDNGVAQELILSGFAADTNFSRPVTLSILTILANKYKIETLPNLIAALEQRTANLLSASETGNDGLRLEQITSIYALVAGMVRRYSGKESKALLDFVKQSPKDAELGSELARRLEMVVAPQQPLSKENYAVVKPLWTQKVYFQLVSPMLQAATGKDADVQDQQVKARYSTAVLLMVKHMGFPIYEADADDILRISIAVAQNSGIGPETKAALDVIKNTLAEASEKGKGHIRSIIKICSSVFSHRPPSAIDDIETEGACGKLALEIVGSLPRTYDSQHLIPHAPQVQRQLTLVCGHRVREVRKTARLARAAWADLK
ncbi:Dos2-interacting transcription regulator of RNA-Pol-II-domain-containing protein [Fusarium tricinctum]|uniref:MMS19 nucleotide excision repair protein n=1 Tax=Fusarium tricinctum TaxID=61284 RepID=A0A8K0WHS0_9HYPO|nr:Dos2-interacting transcription regulator of RNA-Pol-II-domain-containing protein [Fusarium tricinctum]